MEYQQPTKLTEKTMPLVSRIFSVSVAANFGESSSAGILRRKI